MAVRTMPMDWHIRCFGTVPVVNIHLPREILSQVVKLGLEEGNSIGSLATNNVTWILFLLFEVYANERE